eukprot:7554844-Pyramimonas_sp.AAC.1
MTSKPKAPQFWAASPRCSRSTPARGMSSKTPRGPGPGRFVQPAAQFSMQQYIIVGSGLET